MTSRYAFIHIFMQVCFHLSIRVLMYTDQQSDHDTTVDNTGRGNVLKAVRTTQGSDIGQKGMSDLSLSSDILWLNNLIWLLSNPNAIAVNTAREGKF